MKEKQQQVKYESIYRCFKVDTYHATDPDNIVDMIDIIVPDKITGDPRVVTPLEKKKLGHYRRDQIIESSPIWFMLTEQFKEQGFLGIPVFEFNELKFVCKNTPNQNVQFWRFQKVKDSVARMLNITESCAYPFCRFQMQMEPSEKNDYGKKIITSKKRVVPLILFPYLLFCFPQEFVKMNGGVVEYCVDVLHKLNEIQQMYTEGDLWLELQIKQFRANLYMVCSLIETSYVKSETMLSVVVSDGQRLNTYFEQLAQMSQLVHKMKKKLEKCQDKLEEVQHQMKKAEVGYSQRMEILKKEIDTSLINKLLALGYKVK